VADDQRRKDERTGAGRCWIYRDSYHYAQVSFSKPDAKLYPTAVEYMRVLSREEVEKLAFSEAGVDPMQLINSLHRTIDGQRRDINMLKEKLAVRDRENGALAESYLSKMGLKPEDLR
jgi:hypothetical protein